jgi:hypothetical protein
MTTILRRSFLRSVRQGDIKDPHLFLFQKDSEIEAELIGVHADSGKFYHCKAIKKDADKFVVDGLTCANLLDEFI